MNLEHYAIYYTMEAFVVVVDVVVDVVVVETFPAFPQCSPPLWKDKQDHIKVHMEFVIWRPQRAECFRTYF